MQLPRDRERLVPRQIASFLGTNQFSCDYSMKPNYPNHQIPTAKYYKHDQVVSSAPRSKVKDLPRAAPPVYRPRPVPQAVQPKLARAAQLPKPPVAPPVYRPQPTPLVLQTKSANVVATTGNRAAQIRVSVPIRTGKGSYRITVGTGNQQVGSVMVHERDQSSIQVTDLSVNQAHRKQGLGNALIASALRTGLQLGRTRVVLNSQDNGSGHLTRWYQDMGFSRTAASRRGYPQLEASISRVLSNVARERVIAPMQPPLSESRSVLRKTPSSVNQQPIRFDRTNIRAKNIFPSPIQRTGAIQRMKSSSLKSIAEELNSAPSGGPDSRNTQAVVRTEDNQTIAFTQREYKAFDEAIESAEVSYGVKIDERVIADQKDDEGIHAEMLAVSWWLQGHIKKPKTIGVSQGICARCQAVLDALGITGTPKGGHYTKNWVHPYRHAGKNPPGSLKGLPQKVTKGKEYGWD